MGTLMPPLYRASFCNKMLEGSPWDLEVPVSNGGVRVSTVIWMTYRKNTLI